MATTPLVPGVVLDPGLWTTPNNVLTNNGARAQLNVGSTAQNTDHPLVIGGWTVDLPEGATVSGVTIGTETLAANASGLTLFVMATSMGVTLLPRTSILMSSTEGVRNVSFEATREQLLDPSFTFTLIGRKSGANSRVHQVDYVGGAVTYYVEQLTWFDGSTEIPASFQGVWDGTNVVSATYDGNSS